MLTRLVEEELKQLEQFRLGNKQTTECSEILSLQHLLVSEHLTSFLTTIEKKMSAPDLLVAGSMFSKRYGFFAALSLYAMSVLDKKLDTSVTNVSLDVSGDGEVWLPTFIFTNLEVLSAPAENRATWRDDAIKAIFKENIFLIVNQLATVTKLSKHTIWENIAIYIFWFYERLLDDPELEEIRERIQEDFDYVVTKAEGELFGPYDKNPLGRFYHKKVYNPQIEQEVRVRSTCCLYYKTNAAEAKCNTCPLLKNK